MAITPLQLKSDLEKVLEVTRHPTTKKVLTFGLVGKYTYQANGFIDTAIAIGSAKSGVTVEGLEIVIDFPKTESSCSTDKYVQLTEKFTVRMIQRSGENLYPAREIIKRLGLRDYTDSSIIGDVIGNYPQYVFSFRYSEGF
jgi:hypothetical protein